MSTYKIHVYGAVSNCPIRPADFRTGSPNTYPSITNNRMQRDDDVLLHKRNKHVFTYYDETFCRELAISFVHGAFLGYPGVNPFYPFYNCDYYHSLIVTGNMGATRAYLKRILGLFDYDPIRIVQMEGLLGLRFDSTPRKNGSMFSLSSQMFSTLLYFMLRPAHFAPILAKCKGATRSMTIQELIKYTLEKGLILFSDNGINAYTEAVYTAFGLHYSISDNKHLTDKNKSFYSKSNGIGTHTANDVLGNKLLAFSNFCKFYKVEMNLLKFSHPDVVTTDHGRLVRFLARVGTFVEQVPTEQLTFEEVTPVVVGGQYV